MKNQDINLQHVLLHQNSLVEARRWQLMTITCIGVILLLSLAIMFLTPLKTTEIKYVEFSKAGTYHFTVFQNPLEKNQKILLIRHMLRNYVVKRISYTGNVSLDTPNVMSVASMSSSEVLQQFKEAYERVQNESSFERRDVEIISDIPMSRGTHRVEYKTVDYFEGEKYENIWVARISYTLENSLVTEDNELNNPLGLFINGFLEEHKKLTQEQLNDIL